MKSKSGFGALQAVLHREQRQVRLELDGTPFYYWLSLASAVDQPGRDEACRLERVRVTRNGVSDWHAVVSWHSNLWRSKKHHYRFERGVLTHWIEVEGRGRIDVLTFGSGTVDGAEEACVPGFGTVFTGMPNFLDKPWSHPAEYAAISAGNVSELWGSALNGGPLLFAFGERGEAGWIGAGILARPGQYGFQTLALNRKRRPALATQDHLIGTQALSLDYLGNERVSGRWVSPQLILFAGSDASDCLQQYCRTVYRSGCATAPAARRADWWSRPMFCTWHEQVARARRFERGDAGRDVLEGVASMFAQVTERNVRRWLERFEKRGIRFGTVILDAKWQADDGSNTPDREKFPDLRGFIDELHGRGYHVVLWMLAWETRGIPADWCVTRDGKPVMADPTHPKYRAHVRRMLQRMLGDGPGDYNADGLKIDGTNVLPGGAGLRSRGGVYGFELLHAYLKLMYDAAKAAKPDALVDLYGANPYMADCCDVVRLGDLYTFRGDPVHAMRSRAEAFRTGLPHALIETDGALRFSVREDTAELLAEQAQIGIPCLYQAELLYKNRPFVPTTLRRLTKADYDAIRAFVSPAARSAGKGRQ